MRIWPVVDSPLWWRARVWSVVDDVLLAYAARSPKGIRRGLRVAFRHAWQDGAPRYRKRIWYQVVRRALGAPQLKLPDRRQLELFPGGP